MLSTGSTYFGILVLFWPSDLVCFCVCLTMLSAIVFFSCICHFFVYLVFSFGPITLHKHHHWLFTYKYGMNGILSASIMVVKLSSLVPVFLLLFLTWSHRYCSPLTGVFFTCLEALILYEWQLCLVLHGQILCNG